MSKKIRNRRKATTSFQESLDIQRFREQRFDEQNGMCYFCNRRMYRKHKNNWEHHKMRRVTAEHVIPVADGGPNTYENIVAACHECNSRRGRMPAEQFKMLVATPQARREFNKRVMESKKQKSRERRHAQVRHFFGMLMLLSANRDFVGADGIFTAYTWLDRIDPRVHAE